MPELTSPQNCAVYCLAQRFDINALSKLLSDATLIRIIKGALLIEDEQAWTVVFAYGAVVHWNVSAEQQSKLHQTLMQFAENPLKVIEEENFSFSLNCAHTRIAEDHIEIANADPKVIFFLIPRHGAIYQTRLF